MTYDEVIRAGKRSESAINLFKQSRCYYSSCQVSVKLYYSNVEKILVCYCEYCYRRNLHLELEELTTKEIFTLRMERLID